MKKEKLKFEIIFIVVLLLASAFMSNADELTKKVDKLFSKWDSTMSPGAALAIIKNGKIIYERGYGMADLEHNVPITPQTVFRIASTSKQFTAMCIALLVEQGKISLNDNIRKYLPELPEYFTPITIRHLIYHTSGIRDYLDLQYLRGISYEELYFPRDVIELLSWQKAFNFTPGERFLYSNSGYFLLGVIIERVSGKSLAQFAKENIFDPLGMKNTHFHDDHTRIVRNRAIGYSPIKNGWFKISETILDIVGDGGLFTTVEDLHLWDQNFYHNKLGKGGQELIDLILTPGSLNNGKKLDYAFGLRISKYRGLKVISHGGAFVGFRAQMIRFPEQKFSVICLANLSSINPTKLCFKVADIYLSEYFKEPKKRKEIEIKPIKLSEKKLKKIIGNYYESESGRLIKILIIDKKLVMKAYGYDILLLPVSETKFIGFDVPFDISIDFLGKDKKGEKKIRLEIERRKPIILKSIQPPSLSLSQLKEYAGNYYSDELQFIYKIMIKDNKLFFDFRNSPDSPLMPTLKDKFWNEEGIKIDFYRDNLGEIKGFFLSTERARNIEFIKK
jgi:CubicO group peptidase (beta-lactamase class C family)